MHLITIISKYFNRKRNKKLGSGGYVVVLFIPSLLVVFLPIPYSTSILSTNRIIAFRELKKCLFLTVKKTDILSHKISVLEENYL